jgi:hypothetical protein
MKIVVPRPLLNVTARPSPHAITKIVLKIIQLQTSPLSHSLNFYAGGVWRGNDLFLFTNHFILLEHTKYSYNRHIKQNSQFGGVSKRCRLERSIQLAWQQWPAEIDDTSQPRHEIGHHEFSLPPSGPQGRCLVIHSCRFCS